MRRTLLVAALVLDAAVVWAPAAHPAGEEASFSAEVFATPSYHVLELPKVEDGGEGFSWAFVNQSPESWGRSLAFWPGHLADVLLRTSIPQSGPLAGHGWRITPGAWQSYPPGGDGAGAADFGGPLRFPLGTTVETPGGRLRVLSARGEARADEGIGEFAFGDLATAVAPLRVGFARSFARARRDGAAAVSVGWAVLHDVRVGDVTIDEVRSDAEVRAAAGDSTSTWRLSVTGVAVGGHRLAWTDGGVSFAPGSEAALVRLNEELAKGAKPFRSELRLVPGRTWADDTGAHAQSGFLHMGHRPLIAENNPGQRLGYSLSVVSARALYQSPQVSEAQVDAAPDAPAQSSPSTADAFVGARPGSAGPLPLGDVAGENAAALPVSVTEPPEDEMVVGEGLPGQDLAPVTTWRSGSAGLGPEVAKRLRGVLGLVVLAGAAGATAGLRSARRQLILIASTKR